MKEFINKYQFEVTDKGIGNYFKQLLTNKNKYEKQVLDITLMKMMLSRNS